MDDATCRLVGYRLLGTVQIFAGRFREAVVALQQAERYRDPSQKSPSYRFGFDPGLAVTANKVGPLLFLGLHRQAAQAATGCWPSLPDTDMRPPSQCAPSQQSCFPSFCSAILTRANAIAPNSLPIAPKEVEQFRVWAQSSMRDARAARQPTEENIAAIHAALAAKRQSGSRVGGSGDMHQLAEALLRAGDVANAELRAGRSVRLRRTIRRTVLACRPTSARRPDRAQASGAGSVPGGSLFPQSHRNRAQSRSAPVRIARRNRPRPSLARCRFAQRSQRAAGADPRRDRGRRGHARRPQRPRSARRAGPTRMG